MHGLHLYCSVFGIFGKSKALSVLLNLQQLGLNMEQTQRSVFKPPACADSNSDTLQCTQTLVKHHRLTLDCTEYI